LQLDLGLHNPFFTLSGLTSILSLDSKLDAWKYVVGLEDLIAEDGLGCAEGLVRYETAFPETSEACQNESLRSSQIQRTRVCTIA
jgi:hypothetical protein